VISLTAKLILKDNNGTVTISSLKQIKSYNSITTEVYEEGNFEDFMLSSSQKYTFVGSDKIFTVKSDDVLSVEISKD